MSLILWPGISLQSHRMRPTSPLFYNIFTNWPLSVNKLSQCINLYIKKQLLWYGFTLQPVNLNTKTIILINSNKPDLTTWIIIIIIIIFFLHPASSPVNTSPVTIVEFQRINCYTNNCNYQIVFSGDSYKQSNGGLMNLII